MQTQEWSLQDAKNKFSAVVDAAQSGEAQIVKRRGTPAAVVVSVETFQRLQQQEKAETPSFIDHLLAMPQKPDLFTRDNGDLALRDINFGNNE